jgi:hypothetical protein
MTIVHGAAFLPVDRCLVCANEQLDRLLPSALTLQASGRAGTRDGTRPA